MIRSIKGTYHYGEIGSIVVENSSGIGFKINVPDGSSLYGNNEGDVVKVYVSMQVKEDDISLFGFEDYGSLQLFELLKTVNGVGAKASLSIMSILPEKKLRMAIASGDAKTIAKANGVGKKVSERIILELKDKVGVFDTTSDDGFNIPSETFVVPSDNKAQAVEALSSLGYTKGEATLAVSKVLDDTLTVEEYIKEALKNM